MRNSADQFQEKGVALYLSIVILAVIMGIVLGLGSILVSQIQVARGIENSVISFAAAEAGIELLLWVDKDSLCSGDPTCIETNKPAIMPVTLSNDAEYDVSAIAPGSGDCPATALAYCLSSTGSFQEASRAIFIER